MTLPLLRSCLAFGLVLATALPLAAQEPVPVDAPASLEAPAHISAIEGTVLLERDTRIEPASSNMPLLAGDRLRTESGRVEVLFTDGSALHLDHHTTVDFQSDSLLRLLAGRVRLAVATAAQQVEYRIDAPAGSVRITAPGDYKVSLNGAEEVEVAVLRGAAELQNAYGTTAVRAGERTFARSGLAPSYPYVYNSAAWDAFDRWTEDRRQAWAGASSAQYLPSEVRYYAGTFDRYGYWRHHPDYGQVWYPAVGLDWRPYYHGRWAHFSFGWTWIGFDAFAWPTHHYGRWGIHASGAYFWIPGRHWSPAWVSWTYAPGYVGWCPLGWNNRPLLSISVFNIGRRPHWNPWTVLSVRHFGRFPVTRHAVDLHTIDANTRAAFVTRPGPAVQGFAVPRPATPIRWAGTRVGTAVPRGGNLPAPAGGNTGRAGSRFTADVVPNRTAPADRGTGVPLGTDRPGSRSRVATDRSAAPAASSGGAASRARPEASRPASADVTRSPRAVPRQGTIAPDATGRTIDRIAPSTGSPDRSPSRRAVPVAPGQPAYSSRSERRAAPMTPPAVSSPDTRSGPSWPTRPRTVPDASSAPSPGSRAVPRYEGYRAPQDPSPARSAPPVYRSDPRPSRSAPSAQPGAPDGSRQPRASSPPPAPSRTPPSASRQAPSSSGASAPSRSAPSRSAPPAGSSGGSGRAVRRGGRN
jgi:hypothetical protein